MEIKPLRTLATETFKALNGINPNYMKGIFNLSPHETCEKYDLFVHGRDTTMFGNYSLRVLGPHMWNPLIEEMKQLSSINAFKNYKQKSRGQKKQVPLM